MISCRVVSIGTLPAHSLWGERSAVRTGHATCTLVRAGDRVILVDPGLPESAMAARLFERSGLRPPAVTDVFLTRFHPDTCRGITAFGNAKWWIGQEEREHSGVPLAQRLREIATEEDGEDAAGLRAMLEQGVAVLRRCAPAPQSLTRGVSLFPLPGVTPGLCGLLLEQERQTTLICGDAIPTIEHLERGQIPEDAVDLAAARRSFAEAMEIADVLVLGRDNAVPVSGAAAGRGPAALSE